ncbi:MAG: cyclic nucleotide-binding domain-containing protein [Streptosporangiaceae bacterium]|jgi:CRP-like cAMP-binding protein
MPVVPALVALSIGQLIGGPVGCVIGGLLVVIGAPVLAFTRNQMVLTDSGRKLATTVAEVMSLKDADAEAFTKPLAVVARSTRRPERGPARVETADRAVRFWASLTPDERSALRAVARHRTFLAGRTLFREADPARHIYIIRTGRVRISVARGGGGRQIAIRGPGDVVGERAALQVQQRSASGVALTRVRALVVATVDFAEFLQRHPRVLDVLERQVYERLTEDRTPAVRPLHLPDSATRYARVPAATVPAGVPSTPAPAAPSPATPAVIGPYWTGQNCTIFFADVASFGSRGRIDPDRRAIRDALYAMLRDAFDSSGVGWCDCHHEDRGDGVLVIVPPGTPTSLLVDPLTGRLAGSLAAYNKHADGSARMQLRVALHVGPVVSDAEGVSGESIIQAARILEAPVLKRELAATGADLGVITSSFVYDTVIKHLPSCQRSGTYRRVRLRVKESALTAWMQLTEPASLAAAPAGSPAASGT